MVKDLRNSILKTASENLLLLEIFHSKHNEYFSSYFIFHIFVFWQSKVKTQENGLYC